MRKLLLAFLLITSIAQAQVIDVTTASKAITAAVLKEHLSVISFKRFFKFLFNFLSQKGYSLQWGHLFFFERQRFKQGEQNKSSH